MDSTQKKVAAALVAGTLGFSGASLVYAEDTSVEGEASVTVQATTSREKPRPLPLKPRIDLVRDKAQERIENLREGIKAQRIETRIEIKNASSAEERREIMQDARERRADVREDVREVRSNIKDRIKTLVKTHVGAVMRRSENALNMFGNLVERMESRIEKLKQQGVNTTSVEASLEASVSLVATAKADLEALESLVKSVNEASEPETIKAQLRAAIEKVTASIKAAHTSLLSTARALAGLSASVSATSTVSN